MGEVFQVEPSPGRLVVDEDGKGRVHFRVRNASDHEVRMRAQVVAEKQSQESWFVIDGQSERTLARGGTATVVVDVTVPPNTRAGDHYGLALEVADASAAGTQPERGPEVTMDVNARFEPHGRGFVATIVGAVIGGIIGFLLALLLAAFEIGRGVSRGVTSGWTLGQTFTHIGGTIFLGLVIAMVGGLLIPWLFEVLVSGFALRVRHHWGIRHTMVVLAIVTPIWSILAAIVLILVFETIPGRQFFLPPVIWVVTLVLVPPIIARLTTVAGRERAR